MNCINLISERLDEKQLFRGMFSSRLRAEIQPNMGRIQQAGVEAYCNAYLREPHAGYSQAGSQTLSPPIWNALAVWDALSESADDSDLDLYEEDCFVWPRCIVPARRNIDTLQILLTRARHLENFVERAVRLDKSGKTDAALDLIYDNVDSLLSNGKYEELDLMLKNVDADLLPTDILLGLLTATLPAKTKLPSRSIFFRLTEMQIKTRAEWEEGILTGLEG